MKRDGKLTISTLKIMCIAVQYNHQYYIIFFSMIKKKKFFTGNIVHWNRRTSLIFEKWHLSLERCCLQCKNPQNSKNFYWYINWLSQPSLPIIIDLFSLKTCML